MFGTLPRFWFFVWGNDGYVAEGAHIAANLQARYGPGYGPAYGPLVFVYGLYRPPY